MNMPVLDELRHSQLEGEYERLAVLSAGMQALANSSLLAENRRLRSCLAEAIARVGELEKRLKGSARPLDR